MKRTAFLAWVLAAAPLAAAAAGGLTPEERTALRTRAREAFGRGDYEEMVKDCQPLAADSLPRFKAAAGNAEQLFYLWRCEADDIVSLGHAHQLAGQWAEAVAAYDDAVATLDLVLSAQRGRAKVGPAAGKGQAPLGEDKGAASKGAPPPAPEMGTRDAELFYPRIAMLVRTGQIQRDVLKDFRAAAATFARAAEQTPGPDRGLDELLAERTEQLREFFREIEKKGPLHLHGGGYQVLPALSALAELAATQEAMGQTEAAIATRNKVNLQLTMCTSYNNRRGWYTKYEKYMDVEVVGRLIQKLPPGQPLPRTLFVFVLSPEAPTKKFDPLDPSMFAEAWKPRLNFWATQTFVFSPPPGREFASIELTAEVEQTELDPDPAVACSARSPGAEEADVPIGSLVWPPARGPGRQVLQRRFDVPAGAGLLYVDVQQRFGKGTVRSLETKGEFRKRQDVMPPAKASIRVEVNPGGGILTCNGQPFQPTVKPLELEPGRCVIDYRVGGNPRSFHCEADLARGGFYQLFIDLDSPFEWQLTNLRGLSDLTPPRPSLARLPDGRWLVAYGGEDRKVHVSTSHDLLKWEPPSTLPHEVIGNSIEPSLYADDRGTVWLAYFGDRVWWTLTLGYRIWLTSTRDGHTWSRPRPILLAPTQPGRGGWHDDFESWGSSPRGQVQMLRGPNGSHVMVWGPHIGSADSPAHIQNLEPFEAVRGPVRHTHLSLDPDGKMHLVTDSFSDSIYHSMSADGRTWTPPATIGKWPEPGSHLANPQLLFDGPTAAVLCMDNRFRTWLSRGTLGPPARFAPAVMLDHGHSVLSGTQPYVTPDGQILFLAGSDSAWLLRTTLSRLARLTQEF